MILFGSALPTLLSVILSMYNYKLYRYRHSLYMGMAWLFLVGGELLLAYSYLTLDLFVYRLGVIFGAPLLFSIVILLDSISRLDLDLWKFGVSVVVTTGLVITAFDEGSVGYNLSVIGEVGPILRGNFLFWGSLNFGLGGYLWLFYMVKLYMNSPESTRQYAKLALLSAILAGPGASLAFISGLVWIFPGSDYLVIGLASVLMAYAFHKEPKLAFILPFNVYSIYAIESESGINVYSYHWQKSKKVNDQLFTSAIQGISMVLSESLGEVTIRDIVLEEGHLVIQRSEDLTFILFVSEVSNVVIDALTEFVQQFLELHHSNPSNMIDSTHYDQADRIVDERFPFVVERK